MATDGVVAMMGLGAVQVRLAVVVAMLGTGMPAMAVAQVIPGSADPGRVRERVEPQPLAPGSAAPLDLPEVTPGAAPEGAETVRFGLTGVVLEGNTAVATEALSPLYEGFVGREVSLADLYGIAAQITATYRARGFILSQALVPAQRIEGGVARIRVVEGFIDQVAVDGDDPSGRIAAMGGAIAASHPLTAAVLERYLLLIQDLAGVSARAVLAPSPTVAGAADLTLVVGRDGISGYVSLNNHGSKSLGPYQLTAGLQLNNLLWQDGSGGITFLTTPADDELYYGMVSLAQPLWHDGLTLSLSASLSATHPGAALAMFDNDGRSLDVSVDLDYPVIRSRALSLYVSVGFDWRDARSDFFVSTAPTLIYNDHLRIVQAGIRLVATDGFDGRNSLSLTLSRGLNGLGASDRGGLALSRANGDPGFTSLSGEASRTQPLGQRYAVVARTSFQYGFDPLLASEEIGFGGGNYGRAFDPSAITGDSGVGGRLEAVRYWALAPEDGLGTSVFGQAYGFIEGGMIWQRQSPVTEKKRDGLSSAGVGARAQLEPGVSGTCELAIPVDHPASVSKPDKAHLFFQLGASF